MSHRFVPPPRCWLRNLADLGTFPRTVGENGQNGHKGGFSIWGSTPPAAFDPMGNLVTAAWVPGDLASCQSPSCDERAARNPWVGMCYPKRFGSSLRSLPKTAGQLLPPSDARRLQYCSFRIECLSSSHDRPVSEKRHPSFEPSPFGRISDNPKSLLPTFWASEEYQKWMQEKGSKTSPASQHSASLSKVPVPVPEP